jgi:hypothetical protein
VRAWFDTIVNPLIDALETEVRFINAGNFTWRFRPTGFEYIRPVRQQLDPRAGHSEPTGLHHRQ